MTLPELIIFDLDFALRDCGGTWEPFFWDCVDEGAPFGSDEGNDAYYEWRNWRSENPDAPLTDCFNWILDGNLEAYNEELASDAQVDMDAANPADALLGEEYDMFTLDTTITTWILKLGRNMRFNGEPVVRFFAMARQLPVPAGRHRSSSTLI